MTDKRLTHEELLGELRSGMTIGIGGWGIRRKPMSIVRALLRSSLRDLTIVSYGGPDVGLLCASGKVRKVVFGFVSLEQVALEPNFRRAREQGRVEAVELDEGMLQWALYAAAIGLPFLPTRAGLGSDVMRVNPDLRTVRSPYGDGEELVAVPALRLDAAFVHVNRADAAGNGQILGPDAYFDDLFLMAADRGYISTERVVPTAGLLAGGPIQTLRVSRMLTAGVVEAPHGAHFTACEPDYAVDTAFLTEYAKAATTETTWAEFARRHLEGDGEESYQESIRRESVPAR